MSSQYNNEIKIKVGSPQYLKDLSIENTNAPFIFTIETSSAPNIKVSHDISVAKLGDNNEASTSSFEVILSITIHSKISDTSGKEHTVFIFEAKYAGIFSIEGKPDDIQEKRMLFVYAPSILFPFLRRIIATSTGDCGFPSLMLDPIDFSAHFEEQYKKATQKKDN